MPDYSIALAGNPNTGKSTVFNALTGSRQHVGNWPGKTVAKKTGIWRHGRWEFEVVDLPGTYSLSAYSLEEVIARQYLVEERPDVVIVVVDAANLERNLYLAAQILEMRNHVVIALNMADAAASRGVAIDIEALSARLGAPVVATTASKGRGMAELENAVIATARRSGRGAHRRHGRAHGQTRRGRWRRGARRTWHDHEPVDTVAEFAAAAETASPETGDSGIDATAVGGGPHGRQVGVGRGRGCGDRHKCDDAVAGLPAAGRPAVWIDYGAEVEAAIALVQPAIEAHEELSNQACARWLAIKLLEGDADLTPQIVGMPGTEGIVDRARRGIAALADSTDQDVDTLVADGRYQWIHGIVADTVHGPPTDRRTTTDRIDAVVTNRYVGIPIFLVMMWAVFKLTTDVSAPYLDWVGAVIGGPVTRWFVDLLTHSSLGGTWVERLLVDGVIAGVGGVLAFVPVLLSLYLVLALLEDSGYMARAAFVMDRLMRSVGLHGKSFLPMLVGFGCTVPAIYATRTLSDERDRIMTGLLVPFMSCGARLPVYVLFAAIFFPTYGGSIVFAMYLVGIATALLLAVLLRRSVFRTGHQAPFVMELPPYRVPTPRGVLTHVWSRTSSFIRKAWTIILFMSVLLWVLMAIPVAPAAAEGASVEGSLFARTAGVIAPVFAPLGFDSWQSAGAILTGLVAKEVVVSTMAQVYGVDAAADPAADAPAERADGTASDEPAGVSGTTDKALAERSASAADPAGDAPADTANEAANDEAPSAAEDLRFIVGGFVGATVDTIKSIPLVVGIDLLPERAKPPPSAVMAAIHADFDRSSGGNGALAGLAFMVFVLLYTPCMVAVAAARHEFGARWMWTSVLGQLAIAWLMAFAVFQGGRLLGVG